MTEFHSHKWSHITDLPEDWRDYVGSDILNYVSAWGEQKDQLRHGDAYDRFLLRLRRKWAIETGLIERLYSISEGVTLTLIEKGLDASLLERSETGSLDPAIVIRLIRDQYDALDALRQCIMEERQLSTGFIKQLHQVITAAQDDCDAVDMLGRITRTKLIKGDWKQWSNNTRFEDGSVFEYCPPEQVASEMDALMTWHHEHELQGVFPEVEAAWLHHRFTLIHPFMDGNGRIARCLATMIMLKHDRLPLVVSRHNRTEYIATLREADNGPLKPLVQFFCKIQQDAIREAMSLSSDVLRAEKGTRNIVEAAAKRLEERSKFDKTKKAALFHICDALHQFTRERLAKAVEEIKSSLPGHDISVWTTDARRNDKTKAGYHYGQIVRCATKLGYRANLEIYKSWNLLAIEIPPRQRTEMLFSFHGIGEKATGIMGCAGMIYQKLQFWVEEDGTRETQFDAITSLSERPFEFTYRDNESAIVENFERWLDHCIHEGLRIWGESL